jgi:outer membrane protein
MREIVAVLLLVVTPSLAHSEDVQPVRPNEREVYVRLLYGIGTDTPINKIVRGELVLDEERTAIAGIQVGTPISDTFFGWPMEVAANAAVIRHLDKGLQADANEYVVAVKTWIDRFPWRDSLGTRFGVGTGLSYADKVPANERISTEEKGSASHLLLHLDFSIDINLGDLFDSPDLDPCYGGVAAWHRSGVFGRFEAFNNVDGGYNWISLSFECRGIFEW